MYEADKNKTHRKETNGKGQRKRQRKETNERENITGQSKTPGICTKERYKGGIHRKRTDGLLKGNGGGQSVK